jgi:hypothetical protein
MCVVNLLINAIKIKYIWFKTKAIIALISWMERTCNLTRSGDGMSNRRRECTPEWCGSSEGTRRRTATRIDLQVPVRVTGYMRRNDSPPTGGCGASRRVKDENMVTRACCPCPHIRHHNARTRLLSWWAVPLTRPGHETKRNKSVIWERSNIRHALKLMGWMSLELLGLDSQLD